MNNSEMNKIIIKILKRTMKIKKYFEFLVSDIVDNKENLLDYNALEEKGVEFDKDVKSIEVDSHAVMRWNSRVGPNLSASDLETLFSKLILLPHRLKKVKEGFGVVDSEIVFTYEEKPGNKMLITTFYGRRSLNHSLYQIEALRGYNAFQNEQVLLEFDESVLEKQVPPAIPMVYMDFSGVQTDYLLEGYRVSGKELPVFVVHCIPGESLVIDVNESPKTHINKSILMALFLMRYRDFVWEYLNERYEERINRLVNK